MKERQDKGPADRLLMKKWMIPAVAGSLTLAVIAVLLVRSMSGNSEYERQFFAMDTIMSIKAWGRDAEPAVEAAQAEVERLEQQLSVTLEGSEIYTLNQDGEAQVSEETLGLIQSALEIGVETGGAEDITLYPISRLWGFTTDQFRIPTDGEIQETLLLTGPEHIHISGNDIQLDEGTELDLGSIAKGYAADRILEIFESYQVTGGILSLGGNVATYGRKENGGDWSVGIQDPDDAEGYVGVLSVGDKSLTTAGTYQRYFEENGTRYCHIFDPATGYPADSDLKSVTIVSDSGILSDGIDTPLLIMGLDKAVEFWRSCDNFEVVMIDSDGSIYVTQGLQDSMTDCPAGFTVITR